MSSDRKLAKNIGASLLYQVSTPLSTFVLVFFIARYLGASGLGQFSTVMSLLFIFQAISCLGFPYLITRDVAQDRSSANKYLINSLLISIIFSVFMAFIICIVIRRITDNTQTIDSVYILSISLIPYTLAMICESISKAYERFEYVAIPVITGNLVRVVLGLFILLKGYGLINLMVAITFSYFVTFSLNLYFVLRCIGKFRKEDLRPDIAFCRNIIWSAPVLSLIAIFSVIRMNIDTLIISSMMSEQDVGFYSAGGKLVNIFKLGASSYLMALQPVLFRLSKTSAEKYKRTSIESIRYLFILIMPIIAAVTLFSDKIVLLIFKQNFLPSADVFRILVWQLLLYGMNQIFANILISNNDQKINLYANLVGMIVNILLNFLIIPKYGYIGAAIASIASYYAVLIVQHYAVEKRYFEVHYFKLIAKPFFAALIVGACMIPLRNLNIFYSVPLTFATFLVAAITLKTFLPSDVDRLKRILKRDGNLGTL